MKAFDCNFVKLNKSFEDLRISNYEYLTILNQRISINKLKKNGNHNNRRMY
jgi:hypothetical protein